MTNDRWHEGRISADAVMKTTCLLLTTCISTLACFLPGSADEPSTVKIVQTATHIDFLAGTDLVGRYHHGPDVTKPYLWPVNGPGGRAMTRAWPIDKALPRGSTDHVHHKSVWFCHGDVIPEGLELKSRVRDVTGADFWSEGRGHGQIVCTRVAPPKLGDHQGRVETQNEWRTADGTKIIDEMRTIHLVDFGDTRLFVFDIDLHASAVPITFGDTKEGSFGVRVNDAIREQTRNGKIENADGKVGERNCWGRLSAWCDYSGTIDGKSVGLAVLDDPSNRYPACWHVRTYGLMAANPFGRSKSGFPAMKGRSDLVKLAKGEHLKLRYGVLIHPGDAKEGRVAEYFERFVKLRLQQ
jgi:hypothetical protein